MAQHSTCRKRWGVKLASIMLTMLMLFLTPMANAQLKIQESVIEMRSSDAYRVLEFENTGKTSVFITLDLQQVVSPATSRFGEETTVPVKRHVMHITPSLLEIPAHQTAHAVVNRHIKPIKNEEVYRLLVKPVRSADSASIFLNYDLLFLVRPEKSNPNIALHRTPSGMSLVNTGNSNALMRQMQLCDRSIDVCAPLSTQRLYANERWTVPVPKYFNLDYLVLQTEQIHQEKSQHVEYRAANTSDL